MKRIFLSLLIISSALLLIACNGGNNNGGGNNKISLSYADWGDQELNQKMIDAFEKEYPHISVELRTDIASHGEEFTNNLVEASQAGILPDVFATDNVPIIAEKGLTLDVSKYWDEDEDAKLVYEFMANTAIYGNRRYAIPSFQFIKGIIINLDIFENSGLTTVEGKYRFDDDGYPVKDWTFYEMIEIAKAIKNFPADEETTIIGLDTWYGAPDFNQVWPMMLNPDLMYDTWDGEKFNYTDESWIKATEEKLKLHALLDGTTAKYTPEMIEEHPYLEAYIIENGLGAMKIEGSWQFPIIQEARDNGINLGFWPYPRPKEGEGEFFPPVIMDYQAVSAETEHPEEAFLLAKWMTYGRKGWQTRIELLKEKREEQEKEGLTITYLDRFPVANYPEVWEEIDELVDGVEGIQESFKYIHNGKPDIDKWMPGYRDFIRWVDDEENEYNFEAATAIGPEMAATLAPIYNEKVNELYKKSLAELTK